MRVTKVLIFSLLTCLGVAQANAAGCLKGAAVGGVGGHFVGSGHAVLGAAGGCVVGHHMASKKAKEDAQARAQAQQQTQAPQQQSQSSPQ
jgi:outer membrane lipoprotein SlyB